MLHAGGVKQCPQRVHALRADSSHTLQAESRQSLLFPPSAISFTRKRPTPSVILHTRKLGSQDFRCNGLAPPDEEA